MGDACGIEGGPWYEKHMAYLKAISPEGMSISLQKAFGLQMSELSPHPTLRDTDDTCVHYVDVHGCHYWFSKSRENTGWYR
jgi:hypothetical protein